MTRPDFATFYRDHYPADHSHPANVALHMAGTIGALAFSGIALASPLPWLALLFPVIHAAPGLIGHRLFERNEAMGDLRVLRTDFPAYWYIIANHRMTVERIVAPFKRG